MLGQQYYQPLCCRVRADIAQPRGPFVGECMYAIEQAEGGIARIGDDAGKPADPRVGLTESVPRQARQVAPRLVA